MTIPVQHTETLSQVFYVAFRAAWRETFDVMLQNNDRTYVVPAGSSSATGRVHARSSHAPRGRISRAASAGPPCTTRSGFLDVVPLLAGTASHVQLHCLLSTWQKLRQPGGTDLSTVEQVVCYCSVHLLASLADSNAQRSITEAAQGPAPIGTPDLLWLPSKCRALLLTMPVRFPWLADLQHADLLAESLDVMQPPHVMTTLRDELLATVGKWRVSSEIVANSVGLLTSDEIHAMADWLVQNPRVVNF